MSYQVLARKWRPQGFATLIGQQHVVKALSHTLTSQRLHHAYLFTGTRGVGKTTLSRILAKSLNCETGITATPCGVCSACTDIDAGVFTDYIEMDAASNRGVEDMAALLDRAAYAPARGRFKIYMIDEVHMLSNTAFNAMLKTLEEPPEYLKFILATTDPQKIPVTVLSRCLQFSLKPMTVEQVSDYLAHVMGAEQIPAEPQALSAIAKAAQGSMRDALSILDQAIAHGAGQVSFEGVRQMLGVADTSGIYALLGNLAQRDMAAALVQAQSLLDAGVPASNVLDEIANIASRLAVFESAGAQPDGASDAQLAGLMGQFSPEHLQLLYGIAVKAQSEIAFAPNAYAALAMPLLRMQVFAPSATGNNSGYASELALRVTMSAPGAVPAPAKTIAPLADAPVLAVARVAAPPPPSQTPTAPLSATPPSAAASNNILSNNNANVSSSFILSSPEQWPAIANGLPLMSMARMAARESACTAIDGLNIHLALPTQQLTDKALISRVQDALRNLSGKAYVLHTIVVAVTANNVVTATDTTFSQTASAVAHVQQVKVQNEAEQAFANDPLVKGLVSLGGQIAPGSIKPVAPANE
jgi:DNA polymerase III subunit gamma/tau